MVASHLTTFLTPTIVSYIYSYVHGLLPKVASQPLLDIGIILYLLIAAKSLYH